MTGPVILESPHNQKVLLWRELNRSRAARLGQNAFLAEGGHMAQEALATGFAECLILKSDSVTRYQALADRAAEAGLPVYLVSERVLLAVADTKTPQGVFCQCRLPRTDILPCAGLYAALEDVQDPGNVGTVLRTLDAIGSGACVLTKGCADPLSPKALRATMGAVFRVPLYVCDDLPETLSELKAQGTGILAGTLDGTPFYARPADPGRVCLLIGNEGRGLTASTASRADLRVRLPMQGGAESLNAAVAFAVMAYDILRRRCAC